VLRDRLVARPGIHRQKDLRPLALANRVLAATDEALQQVPSFRGQGDPVAYVHGDRPQLYRYGLGSLREVNGILLAAVAFGWLAEAPMAAERDRLGAVLFGLQRG
jgi:hypothetical protein